MAKIGTLIDGKYEVLREIGRGGMSVVYLAMDTRLNKQWAVKEIARKANDANNEIVVSSLLAEANLMKKLDHPSLPRIVDIIEEHDTIYVVMDYIEGEPLSKILELYGAQDQDQVIEWGKQLCDVLFYLHNCEPPIIYRDMKPANVMLRPDGTVKLIDFGIAREYKRAKTADTESLGTRGYAAPEQFGGKGQTDARTDIYCFGVTLYHLVTGLNPCEPPYELYPIKQVNPNFYDGLQYLIQKCTQMNPEDRFQSCDEIRYVLDNIHEFDKGRQIRLKKKLNSFIIMIVMTIVFSILGSGLLFGRKMAIDSNLEQMISNISSDNATEAILSKEYANLNSKSKNYDDDGKLRFYAEYMEKAYELKNSDGLVIPDNSVAIECVEDDLIDSEDLNAEQNRFSNLSSEQRTYLAKFFFYRGMYYFSTANSGNKYFEEAKESFALLFDDGLRIDRADTEYDRSDKNGISSQSVDNALSYYYCSVIYTYYNGSQINDNNNTNVLAPNNGKTESIDIKKCVSHVVNSLEHTDSTLDEGIKRSMYIAYHVMLDNQKKIDNYKMQKISKSDIIAIYEALYGVEYSTISSKIIELSSDGSIANISKDQVAKIYEDFTGGIFGIKWPDNLIKQSNTMKDNIIVVADYINSAYSK